MATRVVVTFDGRVAVPWAPTPCGPRLAKLADGKWALTGAWEESLVFGTFVKLDTVAQQVPKPTWEQAMANFPFKTSVLLLSTMALLGGGLLALEGMSNATQTTGPAPSPQDKKDVDDKALLDLIKQLGDDFFDKREAAGKRLEAIGEPALKLLTQAAREDGDAEVRQRAAQLVQNIGKSLFFEVAPLRGQTQRQGRWQGRQSPPHCGHARWPSRDFRRSRRSPLLGRGHRKAGARLW